MSAILLIASIAFSACTGTDYANSVCFSDLNEPIVYAYDHQSREALIIEHLSDYSANTSYRIVTHEVNGETIVKDSWIVDESGLSGYFTEHWPLVAE